MISVAFVLLTLASPADTENSIGDAEVKAEAEESCEAIKAYLAQSFEWIRQTDMTMVSVHGIVPPPAFRGDIGQCSNQSLKKQLHIRRQIISFRRMKICTGYQGKSNDLKPDFCRVGSHGGNTKDIIAKPKPPLKKLFDWANSFQQRCRKNDDGGNCSPEEGQIILQEFAVCIFANAPGTSLGEALTDVIVKYSDPETLRLTSNLLKMYLAAQKLKPDARDINDLLSHSPAIGKAGEPLHQAIRGVLETPLSINSFNGLITVMREMDSSGRQRMNDISLHLTVGIEALLKRDQELRAALTGRRYRQLLVVDAEDSVCENAVKRAFVDTLTTYPGSINRLTLDPQKCGPAPGCTHCCDRYINVTVKKNKENNVVIRAELRVGGRHSLVTTAESTINDNAACDPANPEYGDTARELLIGLIEQAKQLEQTPGILLRLDELRMNCTQPARINTTRRPHQRPALILPASFPDEFGDLRNQIIQRMKNFRDLYSDIYWASPNADQASDQSVSLTWSQTGNAPLITQFKLSINDAGIGECNLKTFDDETDRMTTEEVASVLAGYLLRILIPPEMTSPPPPDGPEPDLQSTNPASAWSAAIFSGMPYWQDRNLDNDSLGIFFSVTDSLLLLGSAGLLTGAMASRTAYSKGNADSLSTSNALAWGGLISLGGVAMVRIIAGTVWHSRNRKSEFTQKRKK